MLDTANAELLAEDEVVALAPGAKIVLGYSYYLDHDGKLLCYSPHCACYEWASEQWRFIGYIPQKCTLPLPHASTS